MFVTVRYGNDESKIFNINCRNDILLYYIKKRCKVSRDETVELSDEAGIVKNLRNNLNDYGIDYLKERETLILLKVDSSSEGEDTDSNSDKLVFIPMLTSVVNNQEFNSTLNPREDNLRGSKLSLVDSEDGRSKKSKSKEKKKEKKPKQPVKK